MLFTQHPAEHSTKLRLAINNITLPMDKTIKILGLTFNPLHTFAKHVQNTTDKARNTTEILKVLTTTHWRKYKETLLILSTYTAINRTTLKYGSTIWWWCRPLRQSVLVTNYIRHKQTVQNTALRITTGCTRDTSTQRLHKESTLPIKQHLALHASQVRQKAQHTEHTLHQLTLQQHQPRNIKQNIYHKTNYTTNRDTTPRLNHIANSENTKLIHTEIVQSHLQTTR